MSDTTVPVDVPAEVASNNAAFARMRVEAEAKAKEAEAAKAEAASLKAQIAEFERKQMTETERLRAEKADADKAIAELNPIRDEHGRFQSALQKACDEVLAGLPEEARAGIEKFAAHVPLADRLDAIRELAKPFSVSNPVGTVTNPTNAARGNENAPKELPPPDKISWKEAAFGHGKT